MKNLEHKGVSFKKHGEMTQENKEKLENQIRNNKGKIGFNDKKAYIDLNDSIKESKINVSSTQSANYLIYVATKKYEKLLVVQSFPEEKYFFQDKEVTCHELVKILESIKVK